MLPVIDRFENEYEWLSNFHVHDTPMIIDGKEYISNEHYFQACKATTPADHEKVRLCGSPNQAKGKGRQIPCRPDWQEVKEQVMLKGLQAKFAVGSELAAKLLATQPAKLIEGNWWGDSYWGVCRGTGKNRLGVLLMKVRQYLVLQSG